MLGTLPTGEISAPWFAASAGLGKEITVKGNLIRIRDFGEIRLAEISISHRQRSISMVQFKLGSTPEGAGQAGGAEGNGSAN